MSKGDNYRPVDRRKYEQGFETVFGKHPGLKQWDPENDDEVSKEIDGASGLTGEVPPAVPEVPGVESRD